MTDLSNQEPIEHEPARPWTRARNPNRQCTAHKKTGERCTRFAIEGGTVCPSHGGKARQVREKANRRIQEAADRMVQRVLGIAESESVPPAVALAAARDMLDRAGHKPTDKVEIGVDTKPFEELLGRVVGFTNMSREESRRRRGVGGDLPALDSAETIDAEVLEEPVGGWPNEAHDTTQNGPASAAGMRTPSTGVTGPDDEPPSVGGVAGEALFALADMTEEERAVLARNEGKANLRDRQSSKDAAAWEEDNKRRKAAGESGTEVTHTRAQAAADMREQRGVKLRGPGNQARYDAEQL